ncbi:MAG: hypothetical protein WD851_17805 [Pirellulales bacterium]
MTASRIRVLVLLLVVAVIGTARPSDLLAIQVVTVEEHWELRLGEPDANLSAPQVTMTMSPTSNLSGRHFVFTLNHRTYPQYSPGGMQVQRWDGENAVDSHSGSSTSALWHTGEVVAWVQRLHLDDGQLTFEVVDGESESWGSFGGDDLRLHVASNLPNLNDYRPGVSIEESGVGYAGNRVHSLTLSRLIWITTDGVTYELTAPIDVDTDLDP